MGAPGSDADLTQVALSALQGRAVVIYFNGHDMKPVPFLIHAQYHIADDGPLPDGAAWDIPKVVFADPGITKAIGRVSHTEMEAGRAAPILAALDAIANDPTSLTARVRPTLPSAPTDSRSEEDGESSPAPYSRLEWAIALVIDRWAYFGAGLAIILFAMVVWVARRL